MKRWPHAIVLLALIAPGLVHAQSQPWKCGDGQVLFEFQTERPAKWVADTTLAFHPLPATKNPQNLVQFVVDTNGVPDSTTLKVLKAYPEAITLTRENLGKWRYTPAFIGACKVKQLVQTPVGR